MNLTVSYCAKSVFYPLFLQDTQKLDKQGHEQVLRHMDHDPSVLKASYTPCLRNGIVPGFFSDGLQYVEEQEAG